MCKRFNLVYYRLNLIVDALSDYFNFIQSLLEYDIFIPPMSCSVSNLLPVGIEHAVSESHGKILKFNALINVILIQVG